MMMSMKEFSNVYAHNPEVEYFVKMLRKHRPVIIDGFEVESMGDNYAGKIAEVAQPRDDGMVEVFYRAYAHDGAFLRNADTYRDAVACVLTTFVPIEDDAVFGEVSGD